MSDKPSMFEMKPSDPDTAIRGFGLGVMFGIVLNPIDEAMARRNAAIKASASAEQFKGFLDVKGIGESFGTILREEGKRALFKGVGRRALLSGVGCSALALALDRVNQKVSEWTSNTAVGNGGQDSVPISSKMD